jgi:hypothetical protein
MLVFIKRVVSKRFEWCWKREKVSCKKVVQKGACLDCGLDFCIPCFFFERKCGRGSPYSDFGFLKIRTQIHVCGDLNLGGWVVHPLPWPSELGSLLLHTMLDIVLIVCLVIFVVA